MKNVKSGHAKPIVCLDAGHYGKYNRSPVVKTYYESDMVWKLHLLLKKELESYGIQVKQTRTEKEKDRDLYSRGKASDGCDLFLSLHSNAVGSKANESVDYPVVYVQLDGKGNRLGDTLAVAIEKAMGTKQSGCIATRKGKSGEYYGVLRGAAAVGTMGMIVEHSFHTNTRATKWLMDDGNLAKLATAEARVIANWFGVGKVSAPNSGGQTETKYYRIRKSWEDAASQKGAFIDLNNAINSCPAGYKVYDWTGKVMYTTASKFASYRVKVTAANLNVRAGAGTSYKVVTTVRKSEVYTIVDEKDGWGKLKSGAGWISLKYCTKL